jgi:hypothetical protein
LEANYYTKTQVDNKITTVATGGTVSLDNYYTKTQIDASLATKENVSDFNIDNAELLYKDDTAY